MGLGVTGKMGSEVGCCSPLCEWWRQWEDARERWERERAMRERPRPRVRAHRLGLLERSWA